MIRKKNIPDVDRIMSQSNDTEESRRLIDFVGEIMPDAKRNDIKKWLKYDHLRVNGVVTNAFDSPVLPGDMVELNLTRPFVTFSNRRLKIVYEDDDIIVVNKGYGLLSVGTGSQSKEETAYSILKDYVKRKHPSNKIFVVHRLDRDTSGLMMFAKNIDAQTAMQHNWNNMVLERKYVALLEGGMEQQSGLIRNRLGETSQFEVYSTKDSYSGKEALTRYRVIKRGRRHTLVEFELDTGRKNQIRVHARDLGHPIVGDRKYGGHVSPIHRLALHAITLRFAHPVTRKDMRFELPVPSKFVGLLRNS